MFDYTTNSMPNMMEGGGSLDLLQPLLKLDPKDSNFGLLMAALKTKPQGYNLEGMPKLSKPSLNTSPTRLNPREEKMFQNWNSLRAGNVGVNSDPDAPNQFYDARGYYQDAINNGEAPPTVGHLPDTYKLPGHPTFSNESKYYQPGMENQGVKVGRWEGDNYIPLTPSQNSSISNIAPPTGMTPNTNSGYPISGRMGEPQQDLSTMKPPAQGGKWDFLGNPNFIRALGMAAQAIAPDSIGGRLGAGAANLVGLERKEGMENQEFGFKQQEHQLKMMEFQQKMKDAQFKDTPIGKNPWGYDPTWTYGKLSAFKGLIPKEGGLSEIGKLITERDKLPEGDARRVVYDNMINKETNLKPDTTSELKEYEVAKSQGFKGSFIAYKKSLWKPVGEGKPKDMTTEIRMLAKDLANAKVNILKNKTDPNLQGDVDFYNQYSTKDEFVWGEEEVPGRFWGTNTKEGWKITPKTKAMDTMPNANQHTGKIIKDTETGQRYKSINGKWVKQ